MLKSNGCNIICGVVTYDVNQKKSKIIGFKIGRRVASRQIMNDC